eukprot:TRINITY_DN3313_c0_g3_i2.p1 TRINITY_DN3313_c0_g3~~TRINITY_DN3313_c0_g3_i2.p1  ORF type:complete len:833 (+),score=174.39 TRINITY_DN3313_c0_g3_i2:650-3148(+)
MSSCDKVILSLFARKNENFKFCDEESLEDKQNNVEFSKLMENTLQLLNQKYLCNVTNGIIAVIHFGTVDSNMKNGNEDNQFENYHMISRLIEQNGFLSTNFIGSQIIIVKSPFCDFIRQRSQSFSGVFNSNTERSSSDFRQAIYLDNNSNCSDKNVELLKLLSENLKKYYFSDNYIEVFQSKCEFDCEILQAMLGLISTVISMTPETIRFKVSIHCGDFAFTFYGNTKSSFSVTGKVIDEAISMLSFCDFGQIIFPSTINECVSWFEGYQLELVQNKKKHADYVYYLSDISLFQEIMKDHLIDLQTSKMIVVEVDMVSKLFNDHPNPENLEKIDEFFNLSSTVIKHFSKSSQGQQDPLTHYLRGLCAHKTYKYNEFTCMKLNLLQTVNLFVYIVFFVLNDKCIIQEVYFYCFCFVLFVFHLFITFKFFPNFSKVFDNTIQMLISVFVPLMILLKAININQLEDSYAAAIIGSCILTYKQSLLSVMYENKLNLASSSYLPILATTTVLTIFVFVIFFYPFKIHMIYSVPSFSCFFYTIISFTLKIEDHFGNLKEQQLYMQTIEKKIYYYIPKSLFLNCLFQPFFDNRQRCDKRFCNAILFVVHLKIVQDSQSQLSLESVETIDFNVHNIIDNEVSRYKSIICFGNHGNTWFFCSIFENFVDGEFIATYKNPRLNELIPFFQIYEVLKFQFLLRDNLKEKYDSGIKFASINCVSKIQLSVFFNTNIAALFHSNGWNDCLQLLFLSDSNGIFVTEELSFFYKKILVLLRAYHVGSSFKVDAKDKLRFTNFFKNFGVSTDIFTSNYGFKFADESTIHYRNTSRKIFEAYLGKKSCL